MAKKWVNISVLAALVDGELYGEDVAVCEMADIGSAVFGMIAFIDSKRKKAALSQTKASALIVPAGVGPLPQSTIMVKDPVLAAAVIHNYLLDKEFVPTGIDQKSVVGSECAIEKDVSIAAMVFIGDKVEIGHRVKICAGVVIGDGVKIGSDVLIHPNVTILAGSVIGDRVIIHSGTVIGSDGFGYATNGAGRHIKRPQVGYVQVDNDVEIGANVCIDRATFGKTWIKSGCKIDNLIQIAHNVEIGEDSIIVAQSGVAGSTILGRGVIMGGKAAVSGHLKIGNRVTIAGKAGVMSNQEDGAVVAGFPAFSHRNWLKSAAVLQRLPELAKEIKEMKTRLSELLKG